MEQKHTDRKLLAKSLKMFAYTMLLMFTGPGIIYEAFKNQHHPFYLPVLILGFVVSIAAIVMGFLSLRTIMKSLFGN
ncbi:DUF6095 family protein [Zhouia sp. PK063]|uniref:DUF6095 family protein n=1 Tax=Zhouia sp. PK063 TaxID=3373602 RepID=UPI00378DBE0E